MIPYKIRVVSTQNLAKYHVVAPTIVPEVKTKSRATNDIRADNSPFQKWFEAFFENCSRWKALHGTYPRRYKKENCSAVRFKLPFTLKSYVGKWLAKDRV